MSPAPPPNKPVPVGSTIPASISYALRIKPFHDDEANPLALLLGACLIVGGTVAYFYEKDKI